MGHQLSCLIMSDAGVNRFGELSFWKMGQAFRDSYLGKLRARVGTELLMVVGMRCVIEDEHGRVLFVRRRERQAWGLPAGAAEPGESMEDCIRREVHEETGLEVLRFECFGFASNPSSELYTYANGDRIQGFSLLVRALEWRGDLRADDATDEEAMSSRFFKISELPSNHFAHELKTLAALEKYKLTGAFQLD